VKKLAVASHWVRQHIKRGNRFSYREFDIAACMHAVYEIQGKKEQDDVDVPMPEKLKPDKWVDWQEALENYLDSKTSAAGVPLSYVVRTEP
jgi:hypothetical protein